MYYTDKEKAIVAAKRRHTRRAKRVQRSIPHKTVQELQAIEEYQKQQQQQQQEQQS